MFNIKLLAGRWVGYRGSDGRAVRIFKARPQGWKCVYGCTQTLAGMDRLLGAI